MVNKQKKQRKTRSSSPNNRKHHSNSNHGNRKSNHDLLYNMIKGAASSVASQATSTLGDSKDKTSSGVPGDFDMYLLAMSWAPRFCCTNNKQCRNEGMEDTDDLSVHGLW